MADRKIHNTMMSRIKKLWGDKKVLRVTLVCMLLVAVFVVICVIHFRKTNELYGELYHDRIFESAQMSADEITKIVGRRINFLEASAATIASIDDLHSYTICGTLEALSKSDEFGQISFIMQRNSMHYFADGKVQKADYDFYSEKAKTSKNGLAVFYDGDEENPSELTYLYPVVSGGKEIGFLLGVADVQKKFGTIFNTNTTGLFDTLIIDKNGIVIVEGDDNTENKRIIGKNFYTDILVTLAGSDDDSEAIEEKIKLLLYENFIGEISFDGGKYGSGKLIFTSIAGTDDWSLIFCLFDSSLKSVMRPVMIEAIIAIMSLIGVILAMVAVISRYAGDEQKKIHDLAYVDELTKSPNVNAFKERVRQILDENGDLPYLIVCFDILNFRYINEGYGHEKADILLQSISKALSDSYSYNETFARVSADRFVSLVIDDGRNDERIEFIDSKIAETTANILLNYPIKIKTGLYYVRNKDEDVTLMMDKADLARKSVVYDTRGPLHAEYVDKLMEETRKQEQIESRMDMALASGEFVPFLQPKWNMKKNEICGAEALVRWINPDGTIVPPNDFVPLFEKNGFIEKVDFYMLDYVCAYLRRMMDEGRKVYPVSVNQSRFLMHNPEYVSKVKEILIKYRIPKHLIELEITETVFTHDKDHMLEVMNHLKEFNIELSMDDFGSGYSSLNLLRDIPLDVLKIDRGFLGESSQTDSGKLILRKIVEMADGLKLRVICEGVETDEQVNMLLDIGCIYAQGFKYSRPIPIQEYMDKYNTAEG